MYRRKLRQILLLIIICCMCMQSFSYPIAFGTQVATNDEDTNEKKEQKEETKLESNQETPEENKQEENNQADLGETVETVESKTTDVYIESKAAVLIEGSTGEIIFEKNKDEKLRPASITKIMTLLLIFEAIRDGKIKLTDEVSVSEHAASMGGSQVFLEPYEVQTVDTMIKCISVVSANDCCVAMAEFICGSEESFVAKMNERAKELGMLNTNFVNCCGLDVDNHYSSAYDIALMSRELMINYPEIKNYCTIWMDTIIHTTKKGQTEFGLSNTNKLIKTYNGITGLKTGSTGLAKYCLSATARRNDMDMIAVVLAAPDTKTRFGEAAKLLDYGFANCKLYSDDNSDVVLEPIEVRKGTERELEGKIKDKYSYLCLKDVNPENITKQIVLSDYIEAPVRENDKIGEVDYYYNGTLIGSVDILAMSTIPKATYKDYFIQTLERLFLKQRKETQASRNEI